MQLSRDDHDLTKSGEKEKEADQPHDNALGQEQRVLETNMQLPGGLKRYSLYESGDERLIEDAGSCGESKACTRGLFDRRRWESANTEHLFYPSGLAERRIALFHSSLRGTTDKQASWDETKF